MAKKIADPKKRRLIKIGLELLQEAVWLQGQGGITKAKVLDLRTKYGEQRAAQAQEAKELFERISRKLGSDQQAAQPVPRGAP